MLLPDWFRPPRHLLALFLVATVLPALLLGWLAWLALERLDQQSADDALRGAAGRVTADLRQRLEALTAQLPTLAERPALSLSDDTVLLTATAGTVDARPAGRLLYVPVPPSSRVPSSRALDAAAALENQGRLPAAIDAFRRASAATEPAVQAAALLGLGRSQRKAGRGREALETYDRLARLGAFPVLDAPAALVARRAQCAVLADLHDAALATRARALYVDLLAPAWRVDRATFEFYASELRAWLGPDASPPPDAARVALTDLVPQVLQWTAEPQRGDQGWVSTWSHDRPVLVAWHRTPSHVAALLAGRSWFDRPAATWRADNLAVLLTDLDGRTVEGHPPPSAASSVVQPADGLPWTVRVSYADPSRVPSVLARSRGLVLSGFLCAGVLLLAGGSLVARALSRELAVARLQSDFVAAVSHEFRSPLTSMTHLIEMLAQGAVPSEERRRRYYDVLNGEADRLRRLVEDLLDFGRMEAGRADYHFERLDAMTLIRDVGGEPGHDPAAPARLDVETAGGPAWISGDREALTRALRNLLDNATKYSAADLRVHLRGAVHGSDVWLSVQDHGGGIPLDEQRRIFTKFYRGADARRSGIRGTGLGLAAVQHTVRAHRGRVLVDSAPGRGSTFTIVIPLQEAS